MSECKVALRYDEPWLALYIRDHYPIVKEWADHELFNLLSWSISHKLCFYTTSQQRSNPLSSLVLCRPCFDVATVQMYPRIFNRLGHTLYVDLYISTEKVNLRTYLEALSTHFVNKKYIAFGRDYRHTHIYKLKK